MCRESIDLSVLVTSEARSENDHAGKSRPAAHGMDERRTGKVMKSEIVQESAAPCPAADDRIDERDVKRGENQERVQLHAFRNRPGDDCRGGRCEHRLEEPVRKVGVVSVIRTAESAVGNMQPEAVESEYTGNAERIRIHYVEAEEGVERNADCGNREILEHDVRAALCAAKSGLDAGKA